jgi:hypothetical protein
MWTGRHIPVHVVNVTWTDLSALDCAKFADTWCHVVSVMDPYGRILGFLDQSHYVFFQVAPQLYSRG